MLRCLTISMMSVSPMLPRIPSSSSQLQVSLQENLCSLAPLSVPVSGLYRSQAEAGVMLAYHKEPVVPNLCGGQLSQEKADAMGSLV